MKTNTNNTRRPAVDAREQLVPGLQPLDQLIMIVDSAATDAHTIHPALFLPNASVFTSTASHIVNYPTLIS